MTKDQLAEKLSIYLPEGTSHMVSEQLIQHQVQFKISKPRASKLGDYRPPHGNHGHRISVNGDLNPYHFLLTTLHEFAHLDCWVKHKNRVAPHGNEWKTAFQEQLDPVLRDSIFPDDVQKAIERYIQRPKAASCSDPTLVRTLSNYDRPDGLVFLSELPDESRFELPEGRFFIKGPKLRTRYKCKNLQNNRYYLVSSVARVRPI